MKMTYKNLLFTASGTLLCLLMAFSASAQRGNSGGGGGHSSGGGGGSSVSSARPSGGGGGGSFSRPSGNVGVSRPSGSVGMSRPGGVGISRPGSVGGSQPLGSYQRNGISAQRNPTYVNRQGVVVRGNYGYVPRPGATPRGNYGYPVRTGVAPGRGVTATGGYRTAPRIGYGHGDYWGNHGYNHYNHGYYRSYYWPRLGFTCAFLPYGYYPFFWGDYQYYFADGLFYSYNNDQYTVVEPPVGAQITTLPDKAQSIVINGVQYYELNGVYYLPVTKDDGTVVYEVVGKDGELNTADSTVQDQQPQGPQMGDIVLQLPPDCKKIKINGAKLWVSPDGVYYQELVDANGNKTYKVVGLPTDEPDQN